MVKTDKKPGFSKWIYMVKRLNSFLIIPLLIQNPCNDK
ncbi:Uncharacterized protein dnm_018700 [Desulfonema magnum]|uniref:Uncharacterized protein n=1 Tax=Desulfonema magnum TaxID=45655 RepID=A0A975BIS5_9BACT|nr:Uncharacterized protein dnm_018700 [Desulfonema magnum]